MADVMDKSAPSRLFSISDRKDSANKKRLAFLGFLCGCMVVIFYGMEHGSFLHKEFLHYINANRVWKNKSSSPLKYPETARDNDMYVESPQKHNTLVESGMHVELSWNASFHEKLFQLIPPLKNKYQSYLQPVSTIYSETTNVSQETKKLLEHVVRSGYGLKPYKTDRGEAAWMENGIIYQPSRRMNPDGFTAEYESYVPFDEDLFFEGRQPDLRYKSEKKIILWYTKPLYIHEMTHPEPLAACPEFPCLETTNKRYQASSSALIFSDVLIKKGLKPPKRSSPDQVMVIHNHEAPNFLRIILKQDPSWRSIFNWTFSYRMDSDIIRPYAIVRRRPTPPKKKNYRAVLALKTDLIFWAVSNCHTNSRRELYVKELRKYIPVDQMGKCGGLKPCPKSVRENCTDSIAPKYKFYLAFESNLCRDYITEKIFNYIHKDMVIVARGNDDYYRHLPWETFINVDDFPSPKLLAERLWYLHRNEEAYLDILRAKDQYIIMLEDYMVTFSRGHTIHNDFVFLAAPRCLMCQRLWNLERHKRTIPDIVEWFENGNCTTKTI